MDIGWIDSWQLRDKKDVHPSHAQKVVDVKDMIERLKEWEGFSDFRDNLIKELQK